MIAMSEAVLVVVGVGGREFSDMEKVSDVGVSPDDALVFVALMKAWVTGD